MKKTAPRWVRATVSMRKTLCRFVRWYERCLGFLDAPGLFAARHHSDDDFVETPTDR